MIKKSGDIKYLLSRGKKISGPTVNIYLKTASEIGVAVLTPKRIGKAYQRNKMKRLVREIYRKNPSWFSGKKVIFLIKRFNADYAGLEREIGRMVQPR